MTGKFFTILTTFTKKEVENFKLYLQSPLFKVRSRETCIRLLDNLVEAAKSQKDYYDYSAIQKDKILQKTFRGQGESTLNFHLTQLYHALENYLKSTFTHPVDSEWWEEQLWANFRYVEYLVNKECNDIFLKEIKKLKTTIGTVKLSEKRYHIEWKVAQLMGDYLSKNRHKERQSNLIEVLNLYKRHQLITTLKMACQYYNSQEINEQEAAHFNALIDFEIEEKEDPLIALYHQAYTFLKEQQDMGNFVSIIQTQGANIGVHELNTLTLYAENYCIFKIIQNDLNYAKVYIEIAQFSEQIAILSSKINVRYFSNTVKIASMAKTFEWGEQFIENYASYLPKESQEQNKKLCQGLLAFDQGDFDKTLLALSDINFKDPLLEINRRSLIIKSYYETDKHAYLEVQINTYIRYLSTNKKLTERQKKPYKRFHQHLKKLYKLREDLSTFTTTQKQTKIQKLTEQIQAKSMNNKSWLLKKIGEMSG